MNSKERIILIITSVLLIGLLALSVGFAVAGPSGNISETSAELIDEESGEYIVYNAPKDYTLEIALAEGQTYEKDDFAVKDLQDTVVKTDVAQSGNTVTIKAPEGGYVPGDIYTIDLKGKGTFKSEELANAKKLMICIECKEKSKIVYQDGVKELSGKKVQVSDGKIVVDGKYKDGDIIVADTNDDNIDEIYKLKNAEVKSGKTHAELGTPTAEEVYKERDIFFYGYADMSKAQIDPGNVAEILEESGAMDAFVDGAYAAKDTHIKLEKHKTKKDELLNVTITVTNPAAPKKKLLITFEAKDKILAIDKKGVLTFDYTLTLANGIEFTVVGEGKKETEARIKASIESYVKDKNATTEKTSDDLTIVTVPIPICGSVYASVDIGLQMKNEYRAELNAGIDTELTFKQGVVFNYRKLKLQKVYSNITGDLNGYMTVKGTFDSFVGGFIEAGLNIPFEIKGNLSAIGGPYLDADGCFVIDGIPKNPTAEGFYRIETGLRFDADYSIKVFGKEVKSDTIVSKKKSLYVKSNYLELKGTSLASTLYNNGGTIDIGKINAIYTNRLDSSEEKVEIKDYTLKIDDKEVSVDSGKIKSSIESGKHKFELKWEYEGKEYTHSKEVEIKKQIIRFDEKLKLIGMTKAEILKKHKSIRYSTGWWGASYYETADVEGLLIGFAGAYPKDFLYNDAYNNIKCSSLMGTTELMLGIKKTTPIGEIEKHLGIDFSEVRANPSEGYVDVGITTANYKDKNGNNYVVSIAANFDGNVKPTYELIIVNKELF